MVTNSQNESYGKGLLGFPSCSSHGNIQSDKRQNPDAQ